MDLGKVSEFQALVKFCKQDLSTLRPEEMCFLRSWEENMGKMSENITVTGQKKK
jgi:hypothetical protein